MKPGDTMPAALSRGRRSLSAGATGDTGGGAAPHLLHLAMHRRAGRDALDGVDRPVQSTLGEIPEPEVGEVLGHRQRSIGGGGAIAVTLETIGGDSGGRARLLEQSGLAEQAG